MVDGQQTTESAPLLPTTAAIEPQKYPETLAFTQHSYITAAVLILFIVVGFGLRVNRLGAESLSEDELNKLQTVQDYRENGLSGRNGEHPFLMKGLQWLSISAAERISGVSGTQINEEAALRFPVALLGTFTILLIYLLVSMLFGRSVGLVSGALWAVEPLAVSFDRIAKEDSLVLFFFLLANVFWVKSQTDAERGETGWFKWCLLSGVAFAALMSSKYYPWLLANQAAYYFTFQRIPGRRWQLGRPKWLMILAVMAASFLVLNPTIFFPETWREMLKFSSENRIGHDSYEFMGVLYRNQLTLWLRGLPWTFYFVFLGVKSTLAVLIMFVLGLGVVFTRRTGDGRFFMFFWAALWFPAFSLLGGKFTRYFTIIEPFVLITAAVGFCFIIDLAIRQVPRSLHIFAQVAAVALLLVFPLYNSITISPHFRLFTNSLGGGAGAAGSYFPHDEFYDAATRDAASQIAQLAGPGVTVASETPGLYEYYCEKVGRSDLVFISLSDRSKMAAVSSGDLVVSARGRRYFSNSQYLDYLSTITPAGTAFLSDTPAVNVYKLTDASSSTLRSMSR